MEKFWELASEMKEKGFCIGSPFSGRIIEDLKREKLDDMVAKWTEFHQSMKLNNGEDGAVKDIVEVILRHDWSKNVENELEKLNFPLKDEFLSKVIWELKDEPMRALKFFEWLANLRKFEHNSTTYSQMARVLARHEFMGEFWDLVTRMRSKGFEIDTYMSIMRCFENYDAVELFEFMMDGPYKLSERECVSLLKKLSLDSDPDMDLVTRVINKYLEVGNTQTKAIYDIIHGCLCKLGRFDQVKKILEDMRNAGYKPDNFTYGQEVSGLCKLKRFEDACMLLRQMEAEGCVPDIRTWTILIQGYCTTGQTNQAISCFTQMIEKNLEPDGHTLVTLIKGLLSCGKMLGAYEFLLVMVNKARLKPSLSTYKLMIDKLLHDGKLEEAFNLLSMMKQQNYPPYSEPLFVYISKSGTVEDAKKYLRALPMKGSQSTRAYVNVIKSMFNEGRHSEAKDLLDGSPPHVHRHKTIQKLFGLAKSSSSS